VAPPTKCLTLGILSGHDILIRKAGTQNDQKISFDFAVRQIDPSMLELKREILKERILLK
jgi:hypothetical protein